MMWFVAVMSVFCSLPHQTLAVPADWAKLDHVDSKSPVDPTTVQSDITISGPLRLYNGQAYVSVEEGSQARFFGFEMRDAGDLPEDQEYIFKHDNQPDNVLLVAKPFAVSNWHHNLFDAIVPVFRALEQMNMIDHHQDAAKITLVFVNEQGWDVSNTARTLKELLQLHLPNAYLDLRSFLAEHSAQEEMWTWDRVVFLGTNAMPDWEAADLEAEFVNTYLAFRQRTANQMEAKGLIDMQPLSEEGQEPSEGDSEGSAEAEGKGQGARQRVLLVHRPLGKKRSFEHDDVVVEAAKEAVQGVANVASHGCGLWFFDQYNLFHSADVVVAAHGACLSNMLWMRSGSTVVEILPYGYSSSIYRHLANILRLRYFNLMSEPTTMEHFTEPYECSGTVDGVEALTAADCLGKRKNTDPCCARFLRDQKIVVSPEGLKHILQKAMDKAYEPECRPFAVEEGIVELCN